MKLRGGEAVPLERPVSRLLATKRGTLKGNDMTDQDIINQAKISGEESTIYDSKKFKTFSIYKFTEEQLIAFVVALFNRPEEQPIK